MSSGQLVQHNSYGSDTVNLGSASNGSSGSTTLGGGSSTNDAAKAAHEWLMAICWGILIPLGIMSARYFKLHTDSLWFQIHRAVQTLAFIGGIVGFALGFVIASPSPSWDSYPYAVHRNLGIAVVVLGSIQMISLVARPKPNHKYRPYWYLWHAWIGRTSAILAIANIYYGILNVAVFSSPWAWIAYTSALYAIVFAALVLEILNWCCRQSFTGADARSNELPENSDGRKDHKWHFKSASSSTAELL